MYATKNYTTDNGSRTVIGGTLEILDDAEVIGLNSESRKKLPFQADSTASTVSTLRDDYNSLLAKLKTAGFMNSE